MPLSSTYAPSGKATNLRDEATAGPDQGGEGHTTGSDAGSPKKRERRKGLAVRARRQDTTNVEGLAMMVIYGSTSPEQQS